jgi:hypothetical protein
MEGKLRPTRKLSMRRVAMEEKDKHIQKALEAQGRHGGEGQGQTQL